MKCVLNKRVTQYTCIYVYINQREIENICDKSIFSFKNWSKL